LSDPVIRRLTSADAADLSRLLTEDDARYRAYFVGLDTAPPALARMIEDARRDRFWGIAIDGTLAGLIMLRGLDAGYDAPAFGVYVAQSWSRRGLGRLAMVYAEAWCRLEGCAELMLSVDADNVQARRIYEDEGFDATGEKTDRGHAIMRKRLANR
jgi:GNAT superfamily N-acetyltransferase